MFATVRINTPLESIEPYKSVAAERGRIVPVGLSGANLPPRYEFLCVPERAVIDTGSKKVVYVEREPGMFEGVEVELGPRQDDYYPVIKGLKPGDKVAAAGGFLIDAETRLNPAAASTYFGASGGPQSGGRPNAPSIPNPRPAGPGKSDQLPAGDPRPAEGRAGAQGDGRRARLRKTSRTSSNCPRPTGNRHWRSGFARSRALPWARWACR